MKTWELLVLLFIDNLSYLLCDLEQIRLPLCLWTRAGALSC